LTVAGGGIVANDPSNPVEVGQFDDGDSARGVTVVGRYAYVADSSDGLEIIDISDPSNPVEVGQVDDGSLALGVTVVGRYAYVADNTDGLEIIDISDPSNPVEVGQFNDGGDARGVTVVGRYAYLADGGGGLEIIDISDPSNPVEVGQFDDGGFAWGVTVVGRYAYLADSSDGLEIIDISDPSNPVEVGQVADGGDARGVTVVGRYAYLADWTDGLEIIDISDPSNPVEVGQFNDGGAAWGVTVVGRYAYLADSGGGLEIIDIIDPSNPVEVGQFDDGGFARGVTVVGRYAYVADEGDGLEIIDVGGSEFSALFAGALGATEANIQRDLMVGNTGTFGGGLNVGSDAQVGGTLTITGTASSTRLANNNSAALIVATGNVGIGTTTPGSRLTVDGNLALTGALRDRTNSAGLNGMILQTTGTGIQWVTTASLGLGGGLWTASGLNAYFNTGNIGIGTTTPSKRLTVFDTVADAQFSLAYDASRFANFQVDSAGTLILSPTGNDVQIFNSNLSVCEGVACPAITASSTAGYGIFENGIYFGNGFKIDQTSSSSAELGVYDDAGAIIMIFD